jgi:transposase
MYYKMTQEVGSQKHTDRCKCGQRTYLDVLRSTIRCETNSRRKLWESVRRKRPKLWPDNWIPHHGNDLTHIVLRVREFLAKISITKMDHPPYSPDLAPYDLALSKIKKCPEEKKIC